MAGTEKGIADFYVKLNALVQKRYKDDLKRLSEKYNISIKPWNVAYYYEKDKTEVCQFDESLLRKYLEIPRVVQKTIEFLADKYELKFTQAKRPVWHEQVICYDIERDDKLLATLYLDLQQREGKRQGSWMNRLGPRSILASCNFPPKTDARWEMSFDDLTTLMHELGHAMHGVVADSELEALSSPNVFWDFVEVPS